MSRPRCANEGNERLESPSSLPSRSSGHVYGFVGYTDDVSVTIATSAAYTVNCKHARAPSKRQAPPPLPGWWRGPEGRRERVGACLGVR